jgi:hypothetical protein
MAGKKINILPVSKLLPGFFAVLSFIPGFTFYKPGLHYGNSVFSR